MNEEIFWRVAIAQSARKAVKESTSEVAPCCPYPKGTEAEKIWNTAYRRYSMQEFEDSEASA